MAQPITPERPRSILVAEDEEEVRLVVVEALTQAGFEVIEAESGYEALKIIQSNREIGLLFTDIRMPGGMDGFELTHRAKALRPDIRIIYTSGYIKELPWGEHGVGYGAMLPKPYRQETLLAEVRRVFAG